MGERALERLRPALFCAALLALCWAVFAPGLSAGFLLWDDAANLLDNTRWRGLGAEQLRWMFTTFHMGPYQPLSWLSYALDWELWGLDAQAFHRTNVLLHSLNALLCFLCARELLRRRDLACDLGAAAAAALFALHPLRVESVVWVTERRDVLSGLFLLLSLRAWLAYTAAPGRRGAYALALAAYVACLFSKASAVGWPLVLLALDVWVLERGPWRARVREKLPYLALALGFAALALLGQARLPGTLASWSEHGLLARLAQACYGWLYYPLQTLAVVGVRPIYDLPLPMNPFEPRFLAALVLAPALLGAAWALRRRWPQVWAAVLGYTLLALPLLGFAQAGPQLVAARYSYLACLPLALLAGAGIARLARGPALATVCLALLPGWRAHEDARAWRSDRELWTRARELDPAGRGALRNLVPAIYAEARAAADSAVRRARLEEALALCVEGLQLGPDAQLENARGGVLAALAELDPAHASALREQALAALRSALEIARATQGDLDTPESNLITLLDRLGRPAEAVPLCAEWTRRSPESAAAWAAAGHMQGRLNRAQPALEALGRALALDPDLPGAWLDRATILEALGRHEEAREARMQLERLGPAPGRPPMR